MSNRNIAIVWDFDGTLTPQDSTSTLIRDKFHVDEESFWKQIKKINGSKSHITWERLLASDTPTWMFVLSQIAQRYREVLNKDFFEQDSVKRLVKLYAGVEKTLKQIERFSDEKLFKAKKLKISHFIISAGLKEHMWKH